MHAASTPATEPSGPPGEPAGARLVHFLGGLEVGGKERVVLDLARRAQAAGYEVELLLFDTPFRDEQLDLDPGELPVSFLPRRPGVDLRFVRRLAGRWRAQPPVVVHAHNDTGVFYACSALRLARLRGSAACATFHTRPGHDTPWARRSTRWAARRAERITAVSDELAGVLVHDGWVARCESLSNGVDLDAFAPLGPTDGWRQRLCVPSDALLVAHIGRFDPIKRHLDLLEAVRRVKGCKPSMHFVLVGQGPLREGVIAAASDLPNVCFVPRVVDVAAFLRAVDMLVLCSDHEAQPRVVLEAMACRRPIVATAVGGVPQLLGENPGATAGVLVPPRDPGRLAQAIRMLGASSRLRAALGARARERSAAFSAERAWRRWSRLYAEASAARAPYRR